MADTVIAYAVLAGAVIVTVVVLVRRHLSAALASVLDPQVPVRATKCPEIGHRMLLSDLGTWWFCLNDGCTEMWPADEKHRVELPYDREAVQLVDEAEQFLRRVS